MIITNLISSKESSNQFMDQSTFSTTDSIRNEDYYYLDNYYYYYNPIELSNENSGELQSTIFNDNHIIQDDGGQSVLNTKYNILKVSNTNEQSTLLDINEYDYVINNNNNTNNNHEKKSDATYKWLKEKFQYKPNVSISRTIIYELYQQFCRQCNLTPFCKAAFGKMIRNQFPLVKSKRLGARGQSKYHVSTK